MGVEILFSPIITRQFYKDQKVLQIINSLKMFFKKIKESPNRHSKSVDEIKSRNNIILNGFNTGILEAKLRDNETK